MASCRMPGHDAHQPRDERRCARVTQCWAFTFDDMRMRRSRRAPTIRAKSPHTQSHACQFRPRRAIFSSLLLCRLLQPRAYPRRKRRSFARPSHEWCRNAPLLRVVACTSAVLIVVQDGDAPPRRCLRDTRTSDARSISPVRVRAPRPPCPSRQTPRRNAAVRQCSVVPAQCPSELLIAPPVAP